MINSTEGKPDNTLKEVVSMTATMIAQDAVDPRTEVPGLNGGWLAHADAIMLLDPR